MGELGHGGGLDGLPTLLTVLCVGYMKENNKWPEFPGLCYSAG